MEVIKTAAHDAMYSVINIALRGMTLASKFFLMVYLAKVFAPEQLGIYGLFTATISYSLYLLGLDFYTYAQREMLSLPRTEWGGIIRNQFMFYGVVYFFVMPFLLLVFASGLLPWQVIGWFYLVLSLEHLSQEFYRLLVVCGNITLANTALFFRGGAWVFVVVALFKARPEMHSLTTIWAWWSVGVASGIAIAIFGVLRTISPIAVNEQTDWHWIRRGLKVAGQFLLGTLALRGLFTFDRYFLDLYAGKSAVGVYSFFVSIANSLLAFTDAGVISRQYPRIVMAYRTGNFGEYKQHLKKLATGIMLLFVGFAVGLIVTIQPVLIYIGRGEYFQQATTLWILLAAIGIYCLGMVPHYALYARNSDRAIAVASILSLLVFLGGAAAITPHLGLTGMAMSVLLSVGCLGLLKWVFVWRVRISANNKNLNQF